MLPTVPLQWRGLIPVTILSHNLGDKIMIAQVPGKSAIPPPAFLPHPFAPWRNGQY